MTWTGPRFSLAVGFLLLWAPTASAQHDTVMKADDSGALIVNVHPHALPSPPMRYRLTPRYINRSSDNAAVWYGKVFAEQQPLLRNTELWENTETYVAMPLAELREDPVVQSFAPDSVLYTYLERAGRCEQCDWQLPMRREPYYKILLPEMQQSRAFARLLAVRIRYQLAERDFDGAIRSLEAGFGLARNLAKGNAIVCTLISIAVADYMADRLIEYVQQPGAPNLYWALTSLPRPLVSIEDGLLSEVDAMELSFPSLSRLEQDELGSAFWDRALQELLTVAKEQFEWPVSEQSLDEIKKQKGSGARAWLIDAGYRPERVELMSDAQAILLQAFKENQETMQTHYAFAHLPYPQALQRLSEKETPDQDELMIIPRVSANFTAVVNAQMRLEQKLDFARVIEAIRHHAAVQGGQLPDSLSEISLTPIPHDPKTDRPYPSQRRADFLALDTEIAGWEATRFKITVAPAAED